MKCKKHLFSFFIILLTLSLTCFASAGQKISTHQKQENTLLSKSLPKSGIPEQWFADKQKLQGASKKEIYKALPRGHQKIANFPRMYRHGFDAIPDDLNIYVGEAYFVDHCLNHHPDVKDDIYRKIQEILDHPNEVIRDGEDVLLFVKRISKSKYVLVLRYYDDNPGQIVYKTLYPTDRPVKSWLPRVKPE